MLKKSHALVLGITTAGLIGFGAPMASAATVSGPSSLVNVSNNQVPVQACGNDVYGNVIGGQVPVEGDAVVASLLSPGSVTKGTAVNNRGCVMANNQQNKHGDDGSTLVNVSNNQVPVQVCGNDVFINGIGGQVPLYGIAGAIAALSPASFTKSTAVNNQGCASANNQQNGKHHSKDPKGGPCPCQAKHAVNEGPATANMPGHAVNGDAVNTNVAGHPVNGGAVTSGLTGNPVTGIANPVNGTANPVNGTGNPVSGVVNSALQGSK